MAAAVYLSELLVDAQEPTPVTYEGRALRQLIAATLLAIGSPSSPPTTWGGLLDRLADVFSDDGDPVVDREDFLAMGAGLLGTALEMLALSKVDVDRLWNVVTSTFEALDERLVEGDDEAFFVPWLAEVRASLSDIVAEDAPAQVIRHVREVMDSQMDQARPWVAEAYSASLPDDDW